MYSSGSENRKLQAWRIWNTDGEGLSTGMYDDMLCVVSFHAQVESLLLDLVKSRQILPWIPHSIQPSDLSRQEYLLIEQNFRMLQI